MPESSSETMCVVRFSAGIRQPKTEKYQPDHPATTWADYAIKTPWLGSALATYIAVFLQLESRLDAWLAGELISVSQFAEEGPAS